MTDVIYPIGGAAALLYPSPARRAVASVDAVISISSSDEDAAPHYKRKVNFFVLNKFSSTGTRFSHCMHTSCHRAPGWAGGSWINTWKLCVKPSNPQRIFCSFSDCIRKGVLGAHVMYCGSSERSASWYIVPACHRCNRKHGQAARIKPDVALLKVMKGRIFKKNKILVGSVDVEEYNRIKHRMTAELEFDNSKKTNKVDFLRSSASAKHTRFWPEKRIGGWGWKRGDKELCV